MSKTPEEYFQDQDFQPQPEEREEQFTDAEKAFLEKYLGLEEPGILEKLGIDAPVEAQQVSVPAGQGAGHEALPGPEPGPEPEEALEQALEAAPEIPEQQAEVAAEPADEMQEQAAGEVEDEAVVEDHTREAESPAHDEGQDEGLEEGLQTGVAVPEMELEDRLRQQESLQLVSFYVGHQEYTLPIEAVQEVVRAVKPAKVPEAPEYMAGMVNLRGRVTPLVRLDVMLGVERGKTGMDGEEDDGEDRFILVCSQGGLQLGLLVRRVATMYRVAQSSIEWNIESRLGGAVELVTALLRREDDSLVSILSIDRVVERLLKR